MALLFFNQSWFDRFCPASDFCFAIAGVIEFDVVVAIAVEAAADMCAFGGCGDAVGGINRPILSLWTVRLEAHHMVTIAANFVGVTRTGLPIGLAHPEMMVFFTRTHIKRVLAIAIAFFNNAHAAT